MNANETTSSTQTMDCENTYLESTATSSSTMIRVISEAAVASSGLMSRDIARWIWASASVGGRRSFSPTDGGVVAVLMRTP
jgi:hypothetical protein